MGARRRGPSGWTTSPRASRRAWARRSTACARSILTRRPLWPRGRANTAGRCTRTCRCGRRRKGAAAAAHAPVSEQPAENEACRDAYGRTPTGLLADAGALDASFTGVHGTHLDAADVAMLGEAGAYCCVCPTTERDLADGIGRMRPLVDAGVRLAFGSDSHAVIDPFEEAR